MALKKSELYAKLWASCDALRGGMDASLYKDYILVLLFIKYISDKFAKNPFGAIKVPEGASFKDMVALKGNSDIGDQIMKKIIGPLKLENPNLIKMPDFNDPTLLGDDKEMVERLTELISIFEDPQLDFSKQRASDDDILGDAYEYLMRHFATESGKSKGQFYTPSEVSRIMARVIGIGKAKTSPKTTVYDPTCGSGSLLLKVADAATTEVTLYGQEKDAATTGLAYMNMVLHDNPGALIRQGNTISKPHFTEGGKLKQFDYVVANPPFSDKKWSTGITPETDQFERFKTFGTPPGKQGDYAYLLHILRSLKSAGKAACILPHGVLFRGNAEADIRQKLIEHGYIQAIIGLPANLFYGTGIPACILVLDKGGASDRKGIFMIDASRDFTKDRPKNRLRAQDIHRIIDAFETGRDIPRYARFVKTTEIAKDNAYNLNLPRYIDSRLPEDVQDLEGHMRGGIPEDDIEALAPYWAVCPNLKAALFEPLREGYLALKPKRRDIRQAINEHAEFKAFTQSLSMHFTHWADHQTPLLKGLEQECLPKQVIHDLSENLLDHYDGQPLVDPYDIYQHVMTYWEEVMQDDLYQIADMGWVAETRRIIEKKKSKTGKVTEKDKGWTCDLIPKPHIVARYFSEHQDALTSLRNELDITSTARVELEEEHGGEGEAFGSFGKINKAEVNKALKENDDKDELVILKKWVKLAANESQLKRSIKTTEAALDQLAYEKYPELTPDEIKALVVDDKWVATLSDKISGEIWQVAGALTRRVQELGDRYATTLPDMEKRAKDYEAKVRGHLKTMGLSW